MNAAAPALAPRARPARAKAAWLVLLALAALGACALFAGATAPLGVSGPTTDPVDFLAFRCGAGVLASGADPYRTEPLRACERAALFQSGIEAMPYVAVPVSLPPYALAPFEPFGVLRFPQAAALWFSLSLGCIVLGVFAVARLSRLPLAAVTAAMVPLEALTSLAVGQIVPLVVAAVALAALAMRGGRFWPAAAALSATALEPHIALPAWLGAFVAERRMRFPLAVCGAILGASSLLAGGLARNVAYLRDVLPVHEREALVDFDEQYGLTSLLAQAHAGDHLAIVAGTCSYVLAVCVGVALGIALAKRFGDAAFAVVTPPAAAMIGGPYLHDHHFAAALPFALMLVAVTCRRRVALVAVACLAIPWMALVPYVAGATGASNRAAPHRALALARLSDGDRYAADVWQAWLAMRQPVDATVRRLDFAAKVPTWFGAFAVLAIGVAERRRKRRAPVVS